MACSGRRRRSERVVPGAADRAEQDRVVGILGQRSVVDCSGWPARHRRRRRPVRSPSRAARLARVQDLDGLATISVPMPSPGRLRSSWVPLLDLGACDRTGRRLSVVVCASARGARQVVWSRTRILSGVLQRQADVVEPPFSRRCFRRARPRTVRLGPSPASDDLAPGRRTSVAGKGEDVAPNRRRPPPPERRSAGRPFLPQLLKKMSAKDGAMIARKP